MQATFPYLAGWRQSSFWLDGQSLEIPRSISGAETVMPTLRGRWMASVEIVIHGEAAFLQWQAFLAQMQGRIGTTLIPVSTRYRPQDRDGKMLPFDKTAGLAGAQTWEHFGFENTDIPRITLASSAALRATELSLMLNDSTGLRPGQFFSIGERLHRVQHHWQPGNGHRVMIEPPLRAAASAGARLEIARPVCRMRMTSETEGLLSQGYDDFGPKLKLELSEAL